MSSRKYFSRCDRSDFAPAFATRYQSRNRADLVALAIRDLYVAARDNRLPDDYLALFESRLPNGFFGGWPRDRRVREAVIDVLMEKDRSPTTFGRLEVSDDLFTALAADAGSRFGGRTFLSSVRDALSHGEEGYVRRIALLDDLT